MSELRKDPILNRWVIIATERAKRPGSLVVQPEKEPVVSSKTCPLCEGSEHMTPPELFSYRKEGTLADKPGWSVRVVANKFPALSSTGELKTSSDGIFEMTTGVGAHELIVETPTHDSQTADFLPENCLKVFKTYQARIKHFKEDGRVHYVLIFKNHGERGGASLTHPHSQLVALPIIPKLIMEELHGAKAYHGKNKSCVFCDMVKQEMDKGVRVVVQNEHFISICPYAPRYPHETWVLSKDHNSHFEESSEEMLKSLSSVFLETLKKIKIAVGNPSYNFVLHTAPTQAVGNYYHWHFEIIPITTQIAGFERGTDCFINTVSPEISAQLLRETKV